MTSIAAASIVVAGVAAVSAWAGTGDIAASASPIPCATMSVVATASHGDRAVSIWKAGNSMPAVAVVGYVANRAAISMWS